METLKTAWKGLRDGFTRCQVKRSLKAKSGIMKSLRRLPRCNYYEQLRFLHNEIEYCGNNTAIRTRAVLMNNDEDEETASPTMVTKPIITTSVTNNLPLPSENLLMSSNNKTDLQTKLLRRLKPKPTQQLINQQPSSTNSDHLSFKHVKIIKTPSQAVANKTADIFQTTQPIISTPPSLPPMIANANETVAPSSKYVTNCSQSLHQPTTAAIYQTGTRINRPIGNTSLTSLPILQQSTPNQLKTFLSSTTTQQPQQPTAMIMMPPHQPSPSSNALYCQSLVTDLDALTPQQNMLAKIRIQQILFDLKYG